MIISMEIFAITPDKIIKNVEHNLQSNNSYSQITMTVTTVRGERMMKMESWNRGHEKSFIKVLYPKQDRGITFLKIDTTMWQYVPKIEKTIKIPSSMMMQSWMGSDFTNDDMAKESSIVDDYDPVLSLEDAHKYTLTLHPKENAAVVWGRITIEVEKVHFIPLKAIYYDEDGIRQRILYYSNIKVFGSRHLPTVMTLVPINKKNNKTVVRMDKVDFDAPIDDERFTKNALIRYSQ